MFKATQTSYNKVADYRGVKRVWLEGGKLADSGFTIGATYRVEYDLDRREVRLALDPKGDRVVSRKKKRNSEEYIPVLDLASADLVDVTRGAQRVRVDFTAGQLRYTVHHHDAKTQEREARLMDHVMQGTVTEGTLCAGIGVATAALHQGLSEAGITSTVSWIVDRDRRYLQVAQDNNPAVNTETQLFEASLEELEADLLSPVDFLQVSLPCTGHSKAGATKNKLRCAEAHETDATAVFGMMRTIEATNPSVIVSENVVEARDSGTYTLIRSMLQVLGYNLHEMVLDRAQAGSIEQRRRYWLVAVSKGLPELDLSTIPTFERAYQNLGELLEPAASTAGLWGEHEYLNVKAARDKAAGKGFARQLVTEASTTVGTIGRHYMKRRSSEPMLKREDGKERLLTPVEHSRVKGVPEVLVSGLGGTLAHEGLGQGILFNHARGIAQWIAAGLTGQKAQPSNVVAFESRPEKAPAMPAQERQFSLL